MEKKEQEKHIVLIHGTWGNASNWSEMRSQLEARGFTVHTPTLRFHELGFLECAMEVGSVSLQDYVGDLVAYIEALDHTPIIAGLSMGGLLCQLVAARCKHRGVVCFSPAPAWGMFNLYPSMVRIFHYYTNQWAFWRKPLYPSWEEFRWGIVNEQTEQKAKEYFLACVPESGKAYFEMGFWYFDSKRRSHVDIDKIQAPVLVFVGQKDRVVAPRIGRLTAKRYGDKATLIELPEADHCMVIGEQLQNVMSEFDQWLERHHIYGNT